MTTTFSPPTVPPPPAAPSVQDINAEFKKTWTEKTLSRSNLFGMEQAIKKEYAKNKKFHDIVVPYNFPMLYRAAIVEATTLLQTLKKYNLNVVTAESLTAGMICTILVSSMGTYDARKDTSFFGANIYGGINVYDTDAKRRYLSVTTPSVYSERTAKEMAEGALRNSRAMVALAVTGHAKPGKSDARFIGTVFVGVSIRTLNGFTTFTKQLDACGESSDVCGAWVTKFVQGFPSLKNTSDVSYLIRLNVVRFALQFASSKITEVMERKPKLGMIPTEPYDGAYMTCGEPSDVVRSHLDQTIPSELVSWPKTSMPSETCKMSKFN